MVSDSIADLPFIKNRIGNKRKRTGNKMKSREKIQVFSSHFLK